MTREHIFTEHPPTSPGYFIVTWLANWKLDNNLIKDAPMCRPTMVEVIEVKTSNGVELMAFPPAVPVRNMPKRLWCRLMPVAVDLYDGDPVAAGDRWAAETAAAFGHRIGSDGHKDLRDTAADILSYMLPFGPTVPSHILDGRGAS